MGQAGEMTPLLQSDPVAAISAPSSCQVLFALAEDERHLFFPGELPGGCIWENTRGLGQGSWNRLLDRHRPRILVSGWTTPSLDSAQTTLVLPKGPVDYVCHASGSVRHVVKREQLVAGLKVTNWGSLVAPVVAEQALLLMMAALRRLPAWREHMVLPSTAQRELLATRTLHHGRVAIHGFGAIARELIRLLRPFDVTVTVFSEGVPETLIREHGAVPAASLLALADGAGILVSCEALTETSRESINDSVFAALAPDAVFVNVGRGAIVDEAALLRAIDGRGLRFASDVFTNEPLPVGSPFLERPETILSPHIAGPTRDYFSVCGRHALKNIERYLAGETPVGLITPEIFDRST
jgi:phosphoglycerate dehydrogenase-like enzyme